MMKRIAVCLLAFAVLAVLPVSAEIEIGVGVTPPLLERPAGAEDSDNIFEKVMVSLHGGLSTAWLFYASVDAMLLPPYVLQSLTTTYNPTTGAYSEGIYRPGFLTMLDVGIRPKIGPLALLATVGVNMLYAYKEEELPQGSYQPELGVNARVGAYLFLGDNLALTGIGTVVFPDFDQLMVTAQALVGKNKTAQNQAIDRIMKNLVPTVGLVIQF